MANNEFAVERAAGIDDSAAILRHDFQFNVSEQAAKPAGAEL